MQNIGLRELVLFAVIALVAGGIAAWLSLRIAKVFSKYITKINYGLTCMLVIGFITLLALYFSGWLGLIVLATSTAIGLIAPLVNVGRNNAMGVLLLPVILYFLL